MASIFIEEKVAGQQLQQMQDELRKEREARERVEEEAKVLKQRLVMAQRNQASTNLFRSSSSVDAVFAGVPHPPTTPPPPPTASAAHAAAVALAGATREAEANIAGVVDRAERERAGR